MSNASAVRPWPTCGTSYTVGPHTYIESLPGSRVVSSTVSRRRVSRIRTMAGRGEWSVAGRLARLQQRDGPALDALAPPDRPDALAALGRDRHVRAPERIAHGVG